MNQSILRLLFVAKHVILIHPKSLTIKLPNMTGQITERVQKDGKISSLTTKKKRFLHAE